MRILRLKTLLISGILIPLLMVSCMPEDPVYKNRPDISIEELLQNPAVIIVNEGNFMDGNASLSYYNPATKEIVNDVFGKQNNIPLGDVAQSATFYNGELFVVINNSGKIIVMNAGKYSSLKAFEFTHKITGLQSPRYIAFIDSSKAYVSDLHARAISVFNPQNYLVSGKINLANKNTTFSQHPTEQFVVFNDEVFTNCYSYDDKILVIDPHTDSLIDSITVMQQPNSMVLDKNGKIWTLCDGGYEGSEYGDVQPGLLRIDALSHTVEKIFIFPEDNWPSKLCINGSSDTLYFLNGDVWRMTVNSTRLPEVPFVSCGTGLSQKLFYGLGIDPKTSEVYVSDAIDHMQNGVVYRFSPNGEAVDTFRVGIIPGSFAFKP